MVNYSWATGQRLQVDAETKVVTYFFNQHRWGLIYALLQSQSEFTCQPWTYLKSEMVVCLPF